MLRSTISRFLCSTFLLLFFSICAFSNTLQLSAVNIGGGQKQIDATKTYNSLTVGATYTFSFDVINVNKPITISDGTTSMVVSSNGSYTIGFTASLSNHSINFFHQSGGQPAKIELDNVLLVKSEDITSIVCSPVSDDDYRFGFNGMEKDNEVKGNGNSYTTQFRQYDPRLGKWLSLDPLMGKFPHQSPYAAFDNNPINVIDPSGAEGEDWVRGGKGWENNERGVSYVFGEDVV